MSHANLLTQLYGSQHLQVSQSMFLTIGFVQERGLQIKTLVPPRFSLRFRHQTEQWFENDKTQAREHSNLRCLKESHLKWPVMQHQRPRNLSPHTREKVYVWCIFESYTQSVSEKDLNY